MGLANMKDVYIDACCQEQYAYSHNFCNVWDMILCNCTYQNTIEHASISQSTDAKPYLDP